MRYTHDAPLHSTVQIVVAHHQVGDGPIDVWTDDERGNPIHLGSFDVDASDPGRPTIHLDGWPAVVVRCIERRLAREPG
tara:strand:- start:359 stop:595 length:237 start_codon:yes stop_codon:yes gene_type:complete